MKRPHIVMTSWKALGDPRSGGAERYTAVVLEGLANAGYRVTWLAPSTPDAPGGTRDTTNGVTVHRTARGLAHFTRSRAFVQREYSDINLLIDQMNAYPMFILPQFPKKPGAFLLHQLAHEVWFYQTLAPVAAAGYVLEEAFYRFYKGWPVITVSPSTAKDLASRGFKDIHVVRNSVHRVATGTERDREPPDPPVFVSIGRLVPMKRFEHSIEAFRMAQESLPEARLVIVGGGDGAYARRLRSLASATPNVTVTGQVSEEQKWQLLHRATAILATSVREGWGITITESHSAGSPSIAYRVPGLIDSTEDHTNGLLVQPSPSELASAMIRLGSDQAMWKQLSQGALRTSDQLTRNRQMSSFVKAVEAILADDVRRTTT